MHQPTWHSPPSARALPAARALRTTALLTATLLASLPTWTCQRALPEGPHAGTAAAADPARRAPRGGDSAQPAAEPVTEPATEPIRTPSLAPPAASSATAALEDVLGDGFDEGLDPSGRPPWTLRLEERLAAIDARLPGELGVYVKRLQDGTTLRWESDQRWYLASTVKIPVAIAVLEKVDAGELSLEQRLELRETDFVDGAGDLKTRSPGEDFTIAELLERSIVDSDSIATDMLIRHLGVERLNARVQRWTSSGFGPLTTLQQVRYDVYGVLDPGVATLPGRTFLLVRAAGNGEQRLAALAAALGLPRARLGVDNLEGLFERYYASGSNTASLDAFGALLEDLARGALLTRASTERLLDHMQHITTGTRRIQAGLPAHVPFAQKTGTQISRACNVGLLYPAEEARQVVVAACTARHGPVERAEEAFQALGRALAETVLAETTGGALDSAHGAPP